MIHVYFVVLETSLALDLVGPAESLRIANRVLEMQGKPHQFAIHYTGFESSAMLSTGLQVANLTPLPNPTQLESQLHQSNNDADNQANSQLDKAWVVILGQEGVSDLDPHTEQNRQLINWLAKLPIEKNKVEVISVCAGSLFLAYAGRLNHRKATTHHRDLDQLMRVAPKCHVQQDCVFIEDGAIASSAGVTTGIDLMVHKISQVCGEVVASEVAQWLVMPSRRSSRDKQHSPLLSHRSHLHPSVHKAQEAISLSPKTDWSLQSLATLVHTSPRNLTRLFKEHADITPMQYVSQVRLQLAKSALATGKSVTEVADLVGFHSDVQLRRAWHKFGLAGTPSTFRQYS